jgi:tetratricopeptide (TPR) repeat protein
MQPFVEAAVARAGGTPELRAAAEYAFGVAYTELGSYDDALVHLVRARDLWEHELDPTHPEAARVLLTYANVRSYKGDASAAVELWRDVIRLREASLGPNHPAVAGVLANLGRELAEQSRAGANEALRLCERGVTIAEASGSPAVTRGHLQRCLGAAHRMRDEHEAARAAYARAVELTEGTANEYVAYALTDLGTSELEAGDSMTAATHCERAVAMLGTHPDAVLGVGCRGRVRLAIGDAVAARADLEAAVAVYETRTATQVRGELRYALAQALAALNLESDRQRTLARQAHDDFMSVQSTARAATVAQWIATRP